MAKILLISYKMPPYPGVGGYRWSKFAKFLAREGHEIHVVTNNWKTFRGAIDATDLSHENINVYSIRDHLLSNYRYIHSQNRYIRGLRRRLNIHIIKPFFFPDGEAQRWVRYIDNTCNEVIARHNIDVMIATGPPFQCNLYASRLKARHPQIKLIQDFRDGWVDDHHHDTVSTQAEEWQKIAVESADYVISVSQRLLKLFVQDTNQKHYSVIYNGYDPDRLGSPNTLEEQVNKKSTFIYIGNHTCGRNRPLAELFKAIDDIRDRFPDISLVLLGGPPTLGLSTQYQHLFLEGKIEYLGRVPQKVAFAYVANARFGLHTNARWTPFALSTKIYEYAMFKKPVISLNYGGEIEELIENKGLGYSINLSTVNLTEFLIELLSTEKLPEFAFDIEEFSLKRSAQEISSIITGLLGRSRTEPDYL